MWSSTLISCDIIQRYYYAKPLQAVELIEYVTNKKWVE
jgi:hypothetical protein